MIQLDNRFIDFDFRKQKQFVRGSIIPRNAKELCAAMPTYEDSVPVIPSSQWKELADHVDNEKSGAEWDISRIFNQSNEGSCVGNAETQDGEMKQAKQFGKENVTLLSAVSAYQLIGRSPGSGASVPNALEKGRTVGVIPLDTPENRKRFGNVVMPHTGFYTKRPEGWQPVAANFRIDEYYVVRSFEGLMTAGLLGHGAVVGRNGHSIRYIRPTYRGNDPFYLYVNSWRESWGFAAAAFKGGFGADSRRVIQSSASWAFVVRSWITPAWIAA
jgi:hypothetical protein